jgi:hypothetical protein
MNLRAPYVHGYCLEQEELIGVISTFLGPLPDRQNFQTPMSYVPFTHFIRDSKNVGLRDVYIVNTSIEGTHWVIVFVDIKEEEKLLWIVDSLRDGTQYTPTMIDLIMEVLPNAIIKTYYLGLQVIFNKNQ